MFGIRLIAPDIVLGSNNASRVTADGHVRSKPALLNAP